MKILFISPVLSIGGTSKLMSEIIPMINAYKGIEVDFLISRCVNDAFMPLFNKADIKVHTLNLSAYNPLIIFKIAKYLKRYDVIHVNLFPLQYWTAIANLVCRKPMVYTEHNTYNDRRDKWYLRVVEKWVYKRYRKIISISEATQVNLKKWLNAANDDKRFVVINNGVNLESFKNP